MASPFRLLVYAIVAVLIIAVFYTYIAPFFEPNPDAINKIGKILSDAEVSVGRGSTEKITFNSDTMLPGSSFDSRLRNVTFSCNSATLCCPKGVKCDDGIEWDNRKMFFHKETTFETTGRCNLEHDLFTCQIYFGEKPAQVEITRIESEEVFDLSNGKPVISVSIENTGNQNMLEGALDVKVFQIIEEQGRFVEIPYLSASKTETIGSLEIGQKKDIAIELDIVKEWRYKAKVSAIGLEAGSDSRNVSFETKGNLELCSALRCDSLEDIEGRCTARCYCTECTIGTRCLQELKNKGSDLLGLPSVDLETTENYIIGSNTVEFVLENQFC